MSTRFYPLRKSEHRIGSGFGNREGGFHYGLDFEADDGTEIFAIQSGTVQFIGWASGYGQWIVIDSDDDQGGGCIEYGHMWDARATGLSIGSKVKAGDLIAYVGSNGGSTGPHLHITVWPRGYADARNPRVDPLQWLKNARYVDVDPTEESPAGGADMSDGQAIRVQLRGPGDNGWTGLAPQPDEGGNRYSAFLGRNVTAQTLVEAIGTLVFEATLRIASAGRGVADYRKRKGDTVAGNAANAAAISAEVYELLVEKLGAPGVKK